MVKPGSLRQQIMYPYYACDGGVTPTDDGVRDMLAKVGLHQLLARLRDGHNNPQHTAAGSGARLDDAAAAIDIDDCTVDWENALSLGQQQLLAVCRVLWNRPAVCFADECTASMDATSEAGAYTALRQSGITLVSIAHRPAVHKWHDCELRLAGAAGGGSWTVHPVVSSATPSVSTLQPTGSELQRGSDSCAAPGHKVTQATAPDEEVRAAAATTACGPRDNKTKQQQALHYSVAHVWHTLRALLVALPPTWQGKLGFCTAVVLPQAVVAATVIAKGYTGGLVRQALITGDHRAFLRWVVVAVVATVLRAASDVACAYVLAVVEAQLLQRGLAKVQRCVFATSSMRRMCSPLRCGEVDSSAPTAAHAATVLEYIPQLDARLGVDARRSVTGSYKLARLVANSLVTVVMWSLVLGDPVAVTSVLAMTAGIMVARNALIAATSARTNAAVLKLATEAATLRAMIVRVQRYAEAIAFHAGTPRAVCTCPVLCL